MRAMKTNGFVHIYASTGKFRMMCNQQLKKQRGIVGDADGNNERAMCVM